MPNHLVFMILDSCRYDSFVQANTPNFDRIGQPEKRYAYASWTAPSHYAFLMGLMPHKSPPRVFASEVYKEEFAQWVDRLGVEDLSFRNFLPNLSLPKVLGGLGYNCIARVSMPVLNQYTPLAVHFDDYRLMDNHNDFAGMVDEMEFPRDEPQFYFLNLGETHYPYMLKEADLPHISGVHGVFKGMDEQRESQGDQFFEPEEMERLRKQQIKCVEYVDNLFGRVLEEAPENTHFIITADHGEAFGEGDFFGHGPVMHEKAFEVPFMEGKLSK